MSLQHSNEVTLERQVLSRAQQTLIVTFVLFCNETIFYFSNRNSEKDFLKKNLRGLAAGITI